MRNFVSVMLSVVIALILCTGVSASVYCRTADSILYNGNIFTSQTVNETDTQQRWAEAVAVKGRFIIKVGSNEDVLKFQGANTLMTDLLGNTVIPGINLAHTHLLPFLDPINGMFINDPTEWIPGPGPGVYEMLGYIQYLHNILPPNVHFYCVVGEGFINDTTMISRLLLDNVAPGRPVAVYGWSGHYLLLSTSMMQSVGISTTEPDPEFGSYQRFPESNELTGVCEEYASYDFARRIRANIPDEVFQAQLAEIFQGCLQLGCTSAGDVPIGISNDRYARILEEYEDTYGEIPIRIRNIAFPFSIEESENMFSEFELENPLDKVKSGTIKWITDGTAQEPWMCLSEDYSDIPGWRGIFNFSTSDLTRIIRGTYCSANPKKKQLEFHCQGDGALQRVMEVMSENGHDFIWKYVYRTRIVHADVIMPDQYDDIKSKGLYIMKIPNQNIRAALFAQRLGLERYQYAQSVKTLIDEGINVVFCPDALGGVGNPYLDIKLAVLHPNPAEAVSVEEAVYAYTQMGAKSEFMGHLNGSICAGKLANIAVLSSNIFDPMNLPTLENTFSLLTMVDGEILWNTGL